MEVSITQFHAGIGYGPGNIPVPNPKNGLVGVNSVHNRAIWCNPSLNRKGDFSLADAFVQRSQELGCTPVAVLHEAPDPEDVIGSGSEYVRALVSRFGTNLIIENLNETDTSGLGYSEKTGGADGSLAGAICRAWTIAALKANPNVEVWNNSVQSIWETGHGLQTQASFWRAYGLDLPRNFCVHVYNSDVSEVQPALNRWWGAMASVAKPEGVRLIASEVGRERFTDVPAADKAVWERAMMRACKAGGVQTYIRYLLDSGDGYGYATAQEGKSIFNSARAAVRPWLP